MISIRYFVFALVGLLFLPQPTRAADAPKAAEEAMLGMVTAIIENNHPNFVGGATPELQKELSKEEFAKVVEQIEPVLKKGFKSRYLGSMEQQGFTVHLWVLSIRGESDEMLATLSLKEGKVGGFYLE